MDSKIRPRVTWRDVLQFLSGAVVGVISLFTLVLTPYVTDAKRIELVLTCIVFDAIFISIAVMSTATRRQSR